MRGVVELERAQAGLQLVGECLGPILAAIEVVGECLNLGQHGRGTDNIQEHLPGPGMELSALTGLESRVDRLAVQAVSEAIDEILRVDQLGGRELVERLVPLVCGQFTDLLSDFRVELVSDHSDGFEERVGVGAQAVHAELDQITDTLR